MFNLPPLSRGRRAVDMFDWDRAFVNTNVNEKVFILNKTILNKLSNFIPHETVTVDDKEPPWFTKKMRNLIQGKNNVYISIGMVKEIIAHST